jgi:hypothetical protein
MLVKFVLGNGLWYGRIGEVLVRAARNGVICAVLLRECRAKATNANEKVVTVCRTGKIGVQWSRFEVKKGDSRLVASTNCTQTQSGGNNEKNIDVPNFHDFLIPRRRCADPD